MSRVKIRVRIRARVKVRVSVKVSVSYIMTIWWWKEFFRCDKFPTTPDLTFLPDTTNYYVTLYKCIISLRKRETVCCTCNACFATQICLFTFPSCCKVGAINDNAVDKKKLYLVKSEVLFDRIRREENFSVASYDE